ncbi:LysE family translocator [Paraburkholderia sp. SOS3]|uniref:LysE family translocator n=1 Tax=Paraburkholderia sp. SOS3 TaxID=1926494 RepID=UPI0009476260|nr:LysE family translocator [Paraburkholderia sp. SOS3]APR36706.1 lysine transporter LysE [Paraburkholderia sp. SOS3]
MTLFIAMCVFSLTMSISPGPVNMVIVSSGANHGFRRTIPFVSGATIGFTLLLIVVGFWLMKFVSAYPVFLMYLELVGAAFIVYVGYRIALAPPEISIERQRTPTFVEGFLLQWLNPKAWIACASGAALFSSSHATLLAFISVYFLVCYLSLAAWAVLGDRVAVLLHSRLRIRIFNLTMGAMLIATAGYLMYAQVTQQMT